MKQLKEFITTLVTLIQSQLTLRIMYYLGGDSSTRTSTIVSNVSQLRAIENERVYSIAFGPEEVNYCGIIIEGVDQSKMLLSGLGLAAGYEWSFSESTRNTVIFSCPGLAQVLTVPLGNASSKVEFQPKKDLSKITFVPASDVQLSDELLRNATTSLPVVVPFNRLYSFLNSNFYIGGMFHSIDEMTQQDVDTTTLPLLTEESLAKMPRFIDEFVSLYKNSKTRTLAALSMLVGLSGILPNVVSSHFNKKMWANLLLIVSASAGSGKSTVDDVRTVLYSIELWWRARHKDAMDSYREKIKQFKAGEIDEEPERPPLRSLFISLDSSSAAYLRRLFNNKEEAISIDTEIDTFVQNNSKDWGGFSVFLRKAFHFEPIDNDRVEFDVVILKPRITMIMAGTFGQLQRLFKTTEDGFYSRCLVLTLPRTKIELQNPYVNSGDFSFENALSSLSRQALEIYQILLNRNELSFQWNDQQTEKLMSFFTSTAEPFAAIHQEEAEGIIFRHMNMVTRFCMVMSALRAYERNELAEAKSLTASSEDFHIVMEIMDLSLQHNMAILNMLKNEKNVTRDVRNMTKQSFLKCLPMGSTVSRRECLAIGKANGIPQRSVDQYLRHLVEDKSLQQVKIGVYKRTK